MLHAFLANKRKNNYHSGFGSKVDIIYSIRIHIYFCIVDQFNSNDSASVKKYIFPSEFAEVKLGKYFRVLLYIVSSVEFYIANLYIFECLSACTLQICKYIYFYCFFLKKIPLFLPKKLFFLGNFYIVY